MRHAGQLKYETDRMSKGGIGSNLVKTRKVRLGLNIVRATENVLMDLLRIHWSMSGTTPNQRR